MSVFDCASPQVGTTVTFRHLPNHYKSLAMETDVGQKFIQDIIINNQTKRQLVTLVPNNAKGGKQ